MYSEPMMALSRQDHVPGEIGSGEGLASVFRRQAEERFEPGAALFWEGDVAAHLFQIIEGVLRVYKIIGDGRRVITGFLYPGDLVGLSQRRCYLYTAEAVTRVKLRRVTRNRFDEEVNGSPTLRPELFARLSDEMEAAQDQMVLLARKSAEERVASFLLAIARRASAHLDGQPLIDLPMTRLDMADYLGLTIETVSRIMTRLTSRGVIAASGRHAIVVRQPLKLEILAGEGDDGAHDPIAVAYSRQAVWPH
ncbi:CRP/FNR family transcriptional regulator, anaerobic regulatory protein [Kaistia soli DSM 19436]|uniref:CRP/FNR family transcriptional regulator, anaerobic regulatory protein n=1 Tax=Kaistia soli DSM 19436 TaxID=1122133 RepID=A0A1M5FNS1_9HYPH|nr:helix-turn-helix domain-containing protein [Kaistia soli]SHF93136.1 CRP/FNR family transcriptional regulator, anaerobic regulatory protein [Kaistia soli DSM 19436]